MNVEKYANKLLLLILYSRLVALTIIDISIFQTAFNLIYDYFSNPENTLHNKDFIEIILFAFGAGLLAICFNIIILFIPLAIVTIFIRRPLESQSFIISFLLASFIFVILGMIINNGLGHSLGYIGGSKIQDYRLVIYALVGAMSYTWRIKNAYQIISQ